MTSTAVLMYHAIPGSMDSPGGYDGSYAVGRQDFSFQLSALASAGFRCTSVSAVVAAAGDDSQFVAVTFDDGHVSNHSNAFPLLLEHSAKADFFVNTSVVGQNGHLSWSHVREMHDHGMSIQSHAHTHRYLSDLSDRELDFELRESKRTIEDRIGSACDYLAPPGGRYDNRVVRLARELGYLGICTSVPGYWAQRDKFMIPRLAVRDSTSVSVLNSWASGSARELRPLVVRYRLGRVAKTLLGNSRYERIRERVLSAD